MMRAIRVDEFGGPEVLRSVEVDRPTPLPTEVLVRVHAAALNPVDQKNRTGAGMAGLGAVAPPFIPGYDVSGVVEEIGPVVTRFAPGDEVIGMPWFPRAAGCYAEYVTAPSHQFSRKPAALSHAEAAGLPLAGLTAWQALVTIADLQPGQRVLVHAAAGGVGHLAVQIAKARGAYVLGTARAAKHEFLRTIGVDKPIDYTAVDFAEQARDVDVVLDSIGGENSLRSLPTLRPGGLLIAVPSGVDPELFAAAAEANVRASGILVEPDRADLDALVDLVESGALRVTVQQEFPLDKAGDAHELLGTGRTTGKIVLTV